MPEARIIGDVRLIGKCLTSRSISRAESHRPMVEEADRPIGLEEFDVIHVGEEPDP